jgi:hypothetical protein
VEVRKEGNEKTLKDIQIERRRRCNNGRKGIC